MSKSSLVQRTLSGLVFIVVMVGCLLLPYGVLALTLLLAYSLSFEFYRMVSEPRYRKEHVLVTVALVLVLAGWFLHLQLGLPARYMALGLLPLVAAWICQLFDGASDHAFSTVPFFPLLYVLPALLSLLWIAWPGGVFSWRLTLGVLVLIWVNDIGAYCVGMLFGQRSGSAKLFPALSPKKSWVGVVGGTLFCLLAAWGIWAWWGHPVLPLVHWMVIALIESVFGVLGDLYESLIKRHAGVKDAGKLIPGHGGLLDRFDDLLFVLPLTALYLLIFQLI